MVEGNFLEMFMGQWDGNIKMNAVNTRWKGSRKRYKNVEK